MHLFVCVGRGAIYIFIHKQSCRHRKFLGGNLRCFKKVGDELKIFIYYVLTLFFLLKKSENAYTQWVRFALHKGMKSRGKWELKPSWLGLFVLNHLPVEGAFFFLMSQRLELVQPSGLPKQPRMNDMAQEGMRPLAMEWGVVVAEKLRFFFFKSLNLTLCVRVYCFQRLQSWNRPPALSGARTDQSKPGKRPGTGTQCHC